MVIPIEYGVAYDFYHPMIKRAVVDFAVSADWTPATGDVKISKDGGADANLTTLTSAVGSAAGKWKTPISAAEAQCKYGLITIIDSATKAVEDQALAFITFGNASAMIKANLNLANLLADIAAITGNATAATKLKKSMDAVFAGSVTGSSSNTTIVDTTLSPADTDSLKGRTVIFITGALANEATDITAYNAGSHTLTVSQLTQVPQVGDQYIIV